MRKSNNSRSLPRNSSLKSVASAISGSTLMINSSSITPGLPSVPNISINSSMSIPIPSTSRGKKEQEPLYIPLRLDVLDKLATQLEISGVDQEGIFRLSGEKAKAQQLWMSLMKEVEAIDVFEEDPHVIASALKWYLREQPIPLIPFELYDEFIESIEKVPVKEKKLENLLECVKKLPPENKPIFRRLLVLLHKISQKSTVNKMNADNLGIVFGPTLMKAKVETPEILMKAAIPAQIFSILIQNAEATLKLLPQGISNYKIFEGPPPLMDRDWQILLTNAVVRKCRLNELVLGEGDVNYSLYRIKSGRFRVEKNGQKVATMRATEVFGEMSFLGSYQASATVLADEEGAELYVMEVSFIMTLFSVEPEIFMKFYWNMAHKLAQRLESFGKKREDSRPPAGTLTSQVSFTQGDIARLKTARKKGVPTSEVKIYMKDNTVKSFELTEKDTWETLIQKIAKKIRISNPEKYNIYERKGTGAIQLPPHQNVSTKLQCFLTEDYKLILSDTPPIASQIEDGVTEPLSDSKNFNLSEQVVIKDYVCKWGKNGRLFITQHHLSHFAKVLGFEKKSLIPYKEISNLEKDSTNIVVVNKDKTKNKIQFKNSETCEEAFGIIESVWKNYYSNKTALSRRQSQSEEDAIFLRVIVVSPYSASGPGELSLNENDIVVVTSKKDENWWIGECNGVAGYFPSACVEELVDESLLNIGSSTNPKQFSDLPTQEDWGLILVGGREVKFKKGEVLLHEGDRFQRIYQITSGDCNIEKDSKVLGKMSTEETFGEMSFLMGGGATASVVADSEQVEVYVIEAEYLKRQFNKDPRLAGRFFRYLAGILERRLRSREKARLEQENRASKEESSTEDNKAEEQKLLKQKLQLQLQKVQNQNQQQSQQQQSQQPALQTSAGKVRPTPPPRTKLPVVSAATAMANAMGTETEPVTPKATSSPRTVQVTLPSPRGTSPKPTTSRQTPTTLPTIPKVTSKASLNTNAPRSPRVASHGPLSDAKQGWVKAEQRTSQTLVSFTLGAHESGQKNGGRKLPDQTPPNPPKSVRRAVSCGLSESLLGDIDIDPDLDMGSGSFIGTRKQQGPLPHPPASPPGTSPRTSPARSQSFKTHPNDSKAISSPAVRNLEGNYSEQPEQTFSTDELSGPTNRPLPPTELTEQPTQPEQTEVTERPEQTEQTEVSEQTEESAVDFSQRWSSNDLSAEQHQSYSDTFGDFPC